MAVFAATDVSVVVDGTDLSDHCAQVSTPFNMNKLDTTAFGDDWETSIGGIKNGSVTIQLHQDFASSSVDDTIWGAFNTGTPVTIVVKPTSDSVSSTNPSYSFDALPETTEPVASSVGELATQSITWSITGDVTRSTS